MICSSIYYHLQVRGTCICVIINMVFGLFYGSLTVGNRESQQKKTGQQKKKRELEWRLLRRSSVVAVWSSSKIVSFMEWNGILLWDGWQSKKKVIITWLVSHSRLYCFFISEEDEREVMWLVVKEWSGGQKGKKEWAGNIWMHIYFGYVPTQL